MNNEVIGLNLHDCIRDLVLGMPIDTVQKIITGHACRNEGEWESTIVSGLKYYWTNLDHSKVRSIIAELRTADKIEQPSLKNSNHYPIVLNDGVRTVWVHHEDDIIWADTKVNSTKKV